MNLQSKSVTAIIVTYNRLEKLKISLSKALQEPLYKIIVVNNDSSDGTREWLEQSNDSRLISIHLAENTGGAGGFHTGMKYINDNIQTEWILLFDDDAYPETGLIEKFQRIDKKNTDIIATKVLHSSQHIPIKMNRPARKVAKTTVELIQSFCKPDVYACNLTTKENLQPIAIEACSFVGCFIRASAIHHIGLPDPSLFIYCDDLIYTYGATQKKCKLYYFPSLIFFHDCETTNKRLYDNPWKIYFLARNYIKLYRQINKSEYLFMSLIRLAYLSAYTFISKHPAQYFYQLIKGALHGLKKS